LSTKRRMTFWAQRAQDFNGLATTMALGTYEPLSEQIPALTAAIPKERVRHWSLFWAVAYTWVALAQIRVDVPEGERDNVARILLEGLIQSHSAAQPLFDDLSEFIAKRSDVIAQDASGLNFKATIGLWLMWNLTAKAKITDERRVISQLGHLCYEPFAHYWSP
jgi:hypothetical protein